MLLFSLLIVLVILIIQINDKIKAKVIAYEKEKEPMRNDYTLLHYPYVRIELENDDYTVKKLRYASSSGENFKIDEYVDVFWCGNDLLYWNTYDRGLYKFLPSKWKFLF